jgi:integrase/recombinase XerC
VRAPRAAQPLPKALSVDDAVALVAHRDEAAVAGARRRATRASPSCSTAAACASASWSGLDAVASAEAAGWIDAADASAHVLGKGSKRRSVPVGQPALQALAAWLAQRGEVARPASRRSSSAAAARGLTPSQVRSRLKAQALAAGLPTHVHPHMLRHSFASHVLQSSGDLRAVQELLGHANITTTQVYTKLDFGHLSKVYDAAPSRRARKRS